MFNNQLFVFSRESETKRKVLITLHQERPLVLFSRVQNYGEKPSRRSLFINTYSYERGRYMHLSHNQFVIHLKKKFTKSYQQGGGKLSTIFLNKLYHKTILDIAILSFLKVLFSFYY